MMLEGRVKNKLSPPKNADAMVSSNITVQKIAIINNSFSSLIRI